MMECDEWIGWNSVGSDIIFRRCAHLHLLFLYSDYDSEYVRCTKECSHRTDYVIRRSETELFILRMIMLESVILY